MTISAQNTKAQPARLSPQRLGWALVLSWIIALTAALCWPLFTGPKGGQFLLRDMVVPMHPPLTDATLGLSDAAARSVPQDTVLWAFGYFADAGNAVRILLIAACLIGGISAAELARQSLRAGVIGQIVAPTMLLWNPYVVERLLQGQWSLVIAVLLLPAIVVATRMHNPVWRASAIALSAITPTGALLGGITALVSARNWRRRLDALIVTILVSAPWLVATALNPSSAATTDAAGAAAFAARAERFVGTLGAVAGLGGIWNGDAVPSSRETGIAALMVLALLALFAFGARAAFARERGLVLLAIVSVIVISLLATPVGVALMEFMLRTIPGAGLLRDTQKWVGLALPGYVVLAAAGAEALARASRAQAIYAQKAKPATASVSQAVAAAVSVLVIFAAIPTLPGDVRPLAPVPRWDGWNIVSGVVATDDHAVAVLPAGSYRIIEGRPVYDPAIKTLPAEVINSGELIVSGVGVRGEGNRGVEQTLLSGADNPEQLEAALAKLRAEGVGWVLVENSPGNFGNSSEILQALEPVYRDEHLILLHIPGVIAQHQAAPQTHTLMAWIAFAVWALVLVSGPLWALTKVNANRAQG